MLPSVSGEDAAGAEGRNNGDSNEFKEVKLPNLTRATKDAKMSDFR